MVKPQSHVLVDTNVIIESHRIGCWKTLINHFAVDTVEKCVEECATGNQRGFNPVPVDVAALVNDVKPKKVGQQELNALTVRYSEAQYLDPGERHLLAYAMTLENVFLVCSPDKMCVIAGAKLGILDSFISLEELAEKAGARAQLRDNFKARFMERVRTDIKLGIL